MGDGLELLRADAAASRRWRPELLPFAHPHLCAVAAFRVGVAPRRHCHPVLARVVQVIAQTLTGAGLAPRADVGPGLVLIHTEGVVLGRDVVAGRDLTPFGGVTIGSSFGEARADPNAKGVPARWEAS